jgi:hypothetical protein
MCKTCAEIEKHCGKKDAASGTLTHDLYTLGVSLEILKQALTETQLFKDIRSFMRWASDLIEKNRK